MVTSCCDRTVGGGIGKYEVRYWMMGTELISGGCYAGAAGGAREEVGMVSSIEMEVG